MLLRLRLPGHREQVVDVIERLVKHYHPYKAELSVVEDWVRKLEPFPIASVFKVYDDVIERPGQTFRPDLGAFVRDVEGHANLVSFMGKSLAEAIRNAEAGA